MRFTYFLALSLSGVVDVVICISKILEYLDGFLGEYVVDYFDASCCQFTVPGDQLRFRRRICLHGRVEDVGQLGIGTDQVHDASVARHGAGKTVNSVRDCFPGSRCRKQGVGDYFSVKNDL